MVRRALAAIQHSPIVAATLSFLVPGAGQAWAGRAGRGLMLVTPIILLAIGAGGVLATQGTARSLGLLLQPAVLLGILAVNAAIAVLRLFATIDAYRIADHRWPSSGDPVRRWVAVGALSALLVATLGTHAGLGYVGYQAYDTVTTVFNPDPSIAPMPTPSPDGPTPTPGPRRTARPTPAPTPAPIWSSDGRLDLLLIGSDEGPGRWSLRTDTMILLSVDVASGKAALFGIPRNLRNVPLPPRSVNAFPCRCFPELLNAMYRYAEDHPEWFAGEDGLRGLRALEEAVGAMTDLHLDGRVMLTLDGFIRFVNALGGVTVYVPSALYDARYELPDSSAVVEIYFAPGLQYMDGARALAYARTRHQDSDYDRMWRQQQVLLALRSQIDPCGLIVRIPELLDIAGDTFSTNLPIEQLPDLLALGGRVQADAIARYQFWPPEIPEFLDVDGLARIRAMVREPFAAPVAPAPGSAMSSAPVPALPSGPPVPPPAPWC